MVDLGVSATTNGARTDADELRQEVTSSLAVALAAGSGIAWWLSLPSATTRPGPTLVFLSLLLQGLIAFYCRWRRPRFARAILVLGPALSLALALHIIGGTAVPYFAALPVIASSAVAIQLGVASAGLGTVSLCLFVPRGELQYTSLALLWSATGLVWISSRGLPTALTWAWHSQERANRLLEELRDRQGELNRTLTALTEATRRLERANHELAIARRQADEARHIKAQFAANVSHELRTPLNLILGFSEMMVRLPEAYGELRWPPALRADIREIYQAAHHLLGMVNDILDLARVEAQRLPLQLESADPVALIREAAATVRGLLRGKPVELRLNLPERLPEVLVDRARIRQVLLNLIGNAVRFTDQGHIEISAQLGEGQITVEVSDTGVGIPAEEMATIFEEFGQAKASITGGRGGAGLGLAICKQFVRLHGGLIEAESQPGQGSTFRFTLPLPGAGRAFAGISYYAPEGWSPAVPEDPLGKTAVVLGSGGEACTALARAIAGYRTITVRSLEEMAATVEAEHPAGIVTVSSRTGEEAFDPEPLWRAAGRGDLPIVRCQAPEPSPDVARLGAAGYLLKPIQREQLAAAVRTLSPALKSLLVVDDDPAFVALVRRMLEAEFDGLRVGSAYSGQEALAALNEGEYGAVLLDLLMPGMDGYQVLEAMRQDPESALARIPVLLCTASAGDEEPVWLRGNRLQVYRRECGTAELGRYVTALLDAARTDYTRPGPPAGPSPSLPERPAS